MGSVPAKLRPRRALHFDFGRMRQMPVLTLRNPMTTGPGQIARGSFICSCRSRAERPAWHKRESPPTALPFLFPGGLPGLPVFGCVQIQPRASAAKSDAAQRITLCGTSAQLPRTVVAGDFQQIVKEV